MGMTLPELCMAARPEVGDAIAKEYHTVRVFNGFHPFVVGIVAGYLCPVTVTLIVEQRIHGTYIPLGDSRHLRYQRHGYLALSLAVGVP